MILQKKRKVHPISEFLPFFILFPHFFQVELSKTTTSGLRLVGHEARLRFAKQQIPLGPWMRRTVTWDALEMAWGVGSRWVAEVRNKWLGVLDGEADISWFGAPVWERCFDCIDVGMFTKFDLISLCFSKYCGFLFKLLSVWSSVTVVLQWCRSLIHGDVILFCLAFVCGEEIVKPYSYKSFKLQLVYPAKKDNNEHVYLIYIIYIIIVFMHCSIYIYICIFYIYIYTSIYLYIIYVIYI